MPKNDPYDPSKHGADALLEHCYGLAVQAGPASEGSRVLCSLTLFYQHILPFLENDHPITYFLYQVCERSNQLLVQLYPHVGE
jgi:hypothetical protein